MITPRACAAILVLTPIQVGLAQDAPPPITVGYSVPESPAFTFLGVSPTKVTRASNPRDLGAALLNSVDSTGRLLNGLAVAATVWTLFPDLNINPKKYQDDWKAYALANAQLSLGTVRSSGDSGDTDIALGFRTTLLDRSDPMQNAAFVDTLTDSLSACIDAAPPSTRPGGGAGRTDLDESDAALKCGLVADEMIRRKWNRRNWNKPALSLGAGLGWRVPGSRFGDMDHLGLSTWLVGSAPLGRGNQVVGQLQYDHRARRDTLAETDVLTFGARVTRGASNRNLFLEVLGTQRLNTVGGVSRSNVQWSGGVEFQIAPDYWLSTGFGKRYTEQGDPDRMVLIANLRWGVTSKSRFRLAQEQSP